MNIFIDAYNLLKQLHRVTRVSDPHKEHFLRQLHAFAQAKGHHIFVVYDGGQSSRPELYSSARVTIIDSGYKLSADDVIKQKMLHYAPEHTLLVSDDRQLCDYLSSAGFATIGTFDFYDLMQKDIRVAGRVSMASGKLYKNPGYESSPQVDALMREASKYAYEPQDDSIQDERTAGSSERLSKKEKKLKKIVRKL